MTRIAAVKTTKEQKVSAAKRAFILGLLDLSWKLATAVIVPLAIGMFFDEAGSTKYTTIGLFVGIFLAILIIVQLALKSSKGNES